MRLQLKRRAALVLGLAAACLAEPVRADDRPIVRGTSEVAGYADTDHVYVLTPSVGARATSATEGWNVGGSYLVDVVSAASVDILSAASPRWTELRHVGAIDGGYKPGNLGATANAAVSSEPDYLSLNGGGALTLDVLDKNASLLAGYNYTHDTAGRTGTPFSIFSRTLVRNAVKGGGTVLLDSASTLSVVADVMFESGDPSKPYRYVPLFAPGTIVPAGAPVDQVARLRVSARPLEQLPLSRERFAVSGRYAHRFLHSTVRLDERLYADSWGMHATTTDGRVLLDVGRRFELGPHLRLHAQSAVDFWRRAYELRPGFDFPALRTGDRELGPLVGFTSGGTAHWKLGPSAEPRAWLLGFDLNATSTRYLDALYVSSRLSVVGGISLEVER